MPWFTQDAIEFFRELELNNNKPWFEANKKRYEASVKKPMEAFVARVIERMRELDPQIVMQPKDAIFRIYKDVRFSTDKTPYKTNAGAVISRGGRKDHSTPGIYFHFDPRRLGVASGYYAVDPEMLKKFRSFLASNLEEFEQQLNDPVFAKTFKGIEGEKNKILPPELREAAAKQPYLYNKQFYYWAEHDVEEVLRDDLEELLIGHYRAAQSMNEFLGRALQE